MKKVSILFIAVFLSASCCFAEMYPTSRYFEFGVDATLDADQNALTVPEIFTKDIVIDLTALADSMDDSGMTVNAAGDASLFFNANFGKKFGLGFFFDIDASARMGVSKELFDFLGHGNEIDKPVVTSVNAGLEAYLEVGTSVDFKVRKLGFHFTPSYFIPLVYMPQPAATITATSAADGTITVVGDADFAIYSLVNLGSVFDSEFNFLGMNGIINSLSDMDSIWGMLACGGADLSASVEYPLFRSLDVAVYTRIPIVPGRLNYVTTGSASYSVSVDPILDSYVNSGSVSSTTDGPTFSDVAFGEGSYSVNRPFRLGLEGAWRPFGSWCTFRPLLGMAARNPFGDDFSWKSSVYPEYSLSADMRFFYVLGLNLTTAYRDEIFLQGIALTLNFRVLELDVSVASSSSSFAKSWLVSGLKANVGIKMGF